MDVSLNGSYHGYSTILHGAHFHHKLLHIYIQIVWTHFFNFFWNESYKDNLKGKLHICAWAQWWSSCTQRHQIIQVGVELRRSLIRPPAQSRVSYQARPGYLGLYPVGFWKAPRLETAQLPWATALCARDGTAALKTLPLSFLWLG